MWFGWTGQFDKFIHFSPYIHSKDLKQGSDVQSYELKVQLLTLTLSEWVAIML